ncbi:MAG: methyltransferase domain-containing protein [Sulfuritalea sp.]|nr:methyltransferase domain-containing protein [Sulfuritalea sp.]
MRETTLVSGFLAERAWGGSPELTALAFCKNCGFRFFERGLTTEEANKLYKGYRNTEYFYVRNQWEPFYTRAQHEGVVAWAHSPDRPEDLRNTLKQAGTPNHFGYALDHGGNAGHMLTALEAAQKVVFDPSGCEPLPGIAAVSDPLGIPPQCDLLLSCQVLEHVSDPKLYLQQVTTLCARGAHLYIEVPDESWSNRVCHGRLRDAWLKFLLRHHRLLILADMLGTGCRVKLGFLPPMGFIPMREHLNYFTIQALNALLLACGLEILLSGRNGQGQLFAVATIRGNEH